MVVIEEEIVETEDKVEIKKIGEEADTVAVVSTNAGVSVRLVRSWPRALV